MGRKLDERSSVWRCSNGGDRGSSEVREQVEREIDVREERMRYERRECIDVSDLRGLCERERCLRLGAFRGGSRGPMRLLELRLRVVNEGKCGISAISYVEVRDSRA